MPAPAPVTTATLPSKRRSMDHLSPIVGPTQRSAARAGGPGGWSGRAAQPGSPASARCRRGPASGGERLAVGAARLPDDRPLQVGVEPLLVVLPTAEGPASRAVGPHLDRVPQLRDDRAPRRAPWARLRLGGEDQVERLAGACRRRGHGSAASSISLFQMPGSAPPYGTALSHGAWPTERSCRHPLERGRTPRWRRHQCCGAGCSPRSTVPCDGESGYRWRGWLRWRGRRVARRKGLRNVSSRWTKATVGECVVAAAGGDELAFAALFRRCWPLAWSVARAAASTPHAAEEAAVDGFAAAFGGIANLRQPASFPAYLAACVRNEARQAARRQPRPALPAGVTPAPPAGSSPEAALEHGEDALRARAALRALDRRQRDAITMVDVEGRPLAEVSAGSSPEAALEHGEDALRARAALRALDRRQRDAITMVDVEGRPLAEVAAGLDISPNALHQLLHRARASLRQRFVAPPLDVDAPPACRACNDKLARYVSGRAGRRVGATVEEHTARCAACRARLEEARELRSAMRKAYGLAPLLWAAVIGRALRRS